MDNPNITPPEKLRYDACTTVDAQYVPARPVRVRKLAGGDYVVARNCPIGAIAKGYEKVSPTWLPKSGRRVRKAPSFLVAADRQAGMPPTFGFTDIFVPLEVSKEEPAGNDEIPMTKVQKRVGVPSISDPATALGPMVPGVRLGDTPLVIGYTYGISISSLVIFHLFALIAVKFSSRKTRIC